MHFLEFGQMKKRAKKRIALVYPNLYKAGSCSLSMHFIYNLANLHPSFCAERFFLDFDRSIETRSPLSDFDIVAFFLSYEEDYFNVHSIIKKEKIEEKFIIGGGICTLNPYPLLNLLDLFFLGDGEESFPEFLEIFDGLENPKREKGEFTRIKGVFIPGMKERAGKKTSPLSFHPTCQPVQHGDFPTSFKKSLLVEISRGCSRFCKFCLVSHCVGTRRERGVEEILGIIEEAQKRTKFSRIALIASDSHSRLKEILENIDYPVSLPSLKIEDIDEGLLEKLDADTLTIAPETGESERFRLNKRLDDETILQKARLAKKFVKRLKLYMLFGLPEETWDEFSETIDIAKRLSKIMKTKISANAFIPKPHTPFENHQYDVFEIKKKSKTMNRELGIETENPYNGFLQWCLSVGDERVAAMLSDKRPKAWFKAFDGFVFEKKYKNISTRKAL